MRLSVFNDSPAVMVDILIDLHLVVISEMYLAQGSFIIEALPSVYSVPARLRPSITRLCHVCTSLSSVASVGGLR